MVRLALNDPRTVSRIYFFRLLLLGLWLLGLLGILSVRYCSLQITEYGTYNTASDRNRVQLQALPPKRGIIYDRNGVLLAENRPSYVLSLVLERVPQLQQTLELIDELVGVTDNEYEKFQLHGKQRRPYEAVPLRFRLTEEQRTVLAVNRHRLPGVTVQAQLVRHYPQGELFSHVLGYVGRINEAEQAAVDKARYRGTNHIGKTGIEQFYEELLLGEVGYQNVETNARGRVLRMLERTAPTPGHDLTLAVDIRLQALAYQSLQGRRGAVVAMDPGNGEVLALVSAPGFDNNLFVNGISTTDYNVLRNSVDAPLFNRAIQGQYPPGSTIKPVFALAGLESGTVDAAYTVDDPGWFVLPGGKHRFRDWTLRTHGRGHGRAVNLHQAIVESCDVYFYNLAHMLGVDQLHKFSRRFGLGAAVGLDIPHESSGILPSTEWKRRTRKKQWFPGETLSVGIGQGYLLTTPLQLAAMTSIIANRGLQQQPRLLRAVSGEVRPVADANFVDVDEAHWQLIRTAMRDVFHGARGSARAAARGATVTMAGKSGTAQVVGIAQDGVYDAEALAERLRDHGLFIAFAPYEAPLIVVAVIVENGGGGSVVAAPIARKIIEQYLRGVG